MSGGSAPPKIPRPERAPRTISPLVDRLWRELARHDELGARAEDTARVVAGFWSSLERTPVIESVRGAPDERIVTFLWRDAEAEQVLLFVNRLTDERNLSDSLMRRVPGTDVWHLSYRMRADWRASYAFLVRAAGAPAPWTDGLDQVSVRAALDRGLVDPGNPIVSPNRAGVAQSVVALPDAPADAWLRPRDVARGRVVERAGPDDRTVWVYEPPGVPPLPLPIVVALDGEAWAGGEGLPTTVDNLLADGRMRPALVVMPDSGGRQRRWREMGDGGAAVSWVADVLLPWVRSRYPASPDAADVVLAGQSLGALTALRLALTRPDAVGAALSQSASLWQDDLTAAMSGRDLTCVRAYVEVGAQEWVLREPNRAFAARLAGAGARVRFVEYNGGHDHACWRVGIAHGLQSLLPPR
ncbi:enterochelin esterase domain-containing protein [Microbacterium sp. 18062]|uniref:enterochelin esterase domain-containing protein n=1 Tax=Microbacterium sp. 18062 TaxID=2681410 RepID=UPI00135B9010|nr:enterochelin esterase domain-containing protein [Microbacterium sp. 18062]